MKDNNEGRAKRWAVINTIATVTLIIWNYLIGTGLLFSTSVGTVSDRYRSAFTPADYAFSIWGVIFLSLMIFCGFQIKRAFFDAAKDASRAAFVNVMGPLFLLAQICCGIWLIAWLTENLLASVLIMTALWSSLFAIVLRLNMERENAPLSVITCVWWPLSLYSGWITVALLANISSYLVFQGAAFPQSVEWGIFLATVLTVVNLFMIFWRNMREFALVAVWAMVALAVRYLKMEEQPILSGAALGLSLLLLLAGGFHAYRNFTFPPRDAPPRRRINDPIGRSLN